MMYPHIITGDTLAIRTKQRNFLILRLHGAARFATQLGLDSNVILYGIIISRLKDEQLADKKETIEARANEHS